MVWVNVSEIIEPHSYGAVCSSDQSRQFFNLFGARMKLAKWKFQVQIERYNKLVTGPTIQSHKKKYF